MASTTFSLLLLLSSLFLSTASSALNNSSQPINLSSVKVICKSTPYPDACFDSLKLSLDINISPNIITFLLQSLRTALSEGLKLTYLFSNAGGGAGAGTKLVEKQRGTVQDCSELHQITLASLRKSVERITISAADSRKLADARAFLSAALTNKITCLEGLDSASGPIKSSLVNSLASTYMHVSNSLSMLPRPGRGGGNKKRRLLGFPHWLSRKSRRVLQSSGDEYDPGEVLTVAADGTGNFTSVSDAINFAPNNSIDRIIIYIREGFYQENVEIPSWKPNIVLVGDGRDVTVISGNRSVAAGWTTFRSATLGKNKNNFKPQFLKILFN